MKIISLLILITIVTFIFAGQSFYKADIEVGEERDIYNFTESTINWNYNLTPSFNKNIENDIQISEYNINIGRYKNILYKLVDFIGYSSTEGAKWGIEYGYTHPEHDLKFFLDFLIKILLIGIIIAFVPLVIPLIALIYLSFKGAYCLIKKMYKFLTKNGKTKKT